MNVHALAPIAVLALLAAGPAQEGLHFAPEEGSSLSKSFTVEGKIVLDAIEVTMNGEEIDASQMGIPSDFEASFEADIECVDVYESIADGRPLTLVRTFEELALRGSDGDGAEEEESFDELLGESIQFVWDEEDEAYEVSYVDGGGDEDALSSLTEDLDLRSLLPADADASDWDARDGAGMALLLPGVNLAALLESELDDVPSEVLEGIDELLGGLELDCSNAGVVDEDGVELGRIALEGSFENTVAFDASTFIGGDEGASLEWERFDVSLTLEVEGEGLWNLEEAHFRSFEMTSEGELVIEFEVSVPDYGISIAGTMELSVTLRHTAQAE